MTGIMDTAIGGVSGTFVGGTTGAAVACLTGQDYVEGIAYGMGGGAAVGIIDSAIDYEWTRQEEPQYRDSIHDNP